MKTPLRILGIDPGLRHTGWGVVELDGARLGHIAHGVIRPDTDASLAKRLATIFSEVSALIIEHRPDAAGIEETLVNVNARAALKLGQARGAAMAALACEGLEVGEFAPRKIKLAVVGTGAADKDQIAFMVKTLLPKAGKTTSDSADALACAICAAHHLPAHLRAAA
ncbi:MAG: crossover junction endodeoxyribonuclease RuvC [Pseudomonadota bacterium]